MVRREPAAPVIAIVLRWLHRTTMRTLRLSCPWSAFRPRVLTRFTSPRCSKNEASEWRSPGDADLSAIRSAAEEFPGNSRYREKAVRLSAAFGEVDGDHDAANSVEELTSRST